MSAHLDRARRIGVAAILAVALLGVTATLLARPEQASATPVSSAGFVTSGSATPATVARGSAVSVKVDVKSDRARSALVDVEIYDSTGRKASQQYWDNQSFAANATRSYTVAWTPATGSRTGTYVVKVGIFSAGWGTLIHWNNQATTVQVTSGSSTSTTTTRPPATTTTTKPPGTTMTTKPPATTTTTTNPPTTPPGSGRFSTLPPGSVLPSGADCAARVRPAAEIRPENAAANANKGGRANANTRSDWSQFNRVDGAFSGTTDEIIQWAACKWGIDEDIVRAQVVKESWWYQSTNGDNGESWGLGQVRQPYHQSAFQYAVNARTSSAYNLDYTYASWRACYEGVYTWLNTVERNGTYGAGDVWGCVGLWFSGRWYVGNDAYLNQSGAGVRWYYDNKTWLTSGFING